MQPTVISDTIQEFNGVRYYLCGLYFQHKGSRLHRVVWEYHNGQIPEGGHVHHVDGNRSNNQPDNLRLEIETDHLSLHMQPEERRAEAKRHLLAKAQPKAAEWHRTEAGSELGKRAYAAVKDTWLEPVSLVCQFCGREYTTVHSKTTHSKFCSAKCKAAARRAAKVDTIDRVCPVCGVVFKADRFKPATCCSKKCAWVVRRSLRA